MADLNYQCRGVSGQLLLRWRMNVNTLLDAAQPNRIHLSFPGGGTLPPPFAIGSLVAYNSRFSRTVNTAMSASRRTVVTVHIAISAAAQPAKMVPIIQQGGNSRYQFALYCSNVKNLAPRREVTKRSETAGSEIGVTSRG